MPPRWLLIHSPQKLRLPFPSLKDDRRKWLWALLSVLSTSGWTGSAAGQTWNLNANGSWGTAANWSPASAPNAVDATANLGAVITAPRVVTLSVPVTIGTLNVSGNQAYTVSGANTLTFDVSSGTAALNVTGTAANTISSPIALNDSLALDQRSSGTLTLAGVVSGSGSISKSGGGTVFLLGANIYTGTTTISAGTLSVGAGGTTGTLGAGAVVNNGILQISRSDASFTLSNDISGTGALTKSNAGTSTTLILTGTNSYAGTTTITEGTIQVGNGGTTGTLGTGGSSPAAARWRSTGRTTSP